MTKENMTVNWLYLPSVPFDIIMTKIAHDSLTTLRSCTEVCSAWNEMIEKDILKNPAVMDTVRDKMERTFGPEVRVNPFDFHSGTRLLPSSEEISNAKWLSEKKLLIIEVIEKFAVWVRERPDRLDSLSLTSCAACLAYHGLLGQAEEMLIVDLWNHDLTSVPTEHLAALASWMSSCSVFFNNVSGIDMDSFLNSLKCQDFGIYRQILGREETEALVQAMESRVERVHMRSVTLEVETLVTYSGLGRCRLVTLDCCDNDPGLWRLNMKEPLKKWALSRDWAVINDKNFLLTIRRR